MITISEINNTKITPKDSKISPKNMRISPKDSRISPKNTKISPKDSVIFPKNKPGKQMLGIQYDDGYVVAR